MRNIVFDTFAIIALLEKEKGHETVSQLLSDISNGEKYGSMSVVNLGEVYYMSYRKRGPEKAELALSSVLHFPIEIVDADFNLTYAAAQLKSRHKISYADAFAVALTIKKKATLITGDSEFKNLEAEKGFKVELI
ncbi:MAG: type II toxin-antitoxin system VapC family toxin [Bacteroidetes bacterium]|nr:type II toxin-antitoxin system VapC family toxin [Bacteroidota bacterium]